MKNARFVRKLSVLAASNVGIWIQADTETPMPNQMRTHLFYVQDLFDGPVGYLTGARFSVVTSYANWNLMRSHTIIVRYTFSTCIFSHKMIFILRYIIQMLQSYGEGIIKFSWF